jgi:uncharacterized membrane protein
MSGTTSGLALGATVVCGLSAGVFFAFSSFVMPALERLDPGARVSAMQAINEKAVTPAFMVVLFGGALLCVAVLAAALVSSESGSSPWSVAGAVLFLVGVVGLTVARHVPLNDALATADPGAADAAARWAAYAGAWVPLNHVRTAAGAVAIALLVVGAVAG